MVKTAGILAIFFTLNLGAATGILAPELHKKKNEDIDIYPSSGTSFNEDNYTGMACRYTF